MQKRGAILPTKLFSCAQRIFPNWRSTLAKRCCFTIQATAEKFLYIEQRHGARLAIFDVTDPGKIKGEDSAQLDGPGSFDFVFDLGDHTELIKFQNGQGVAVLDLHKPKAPTVKIMNGLKQPGLIKRLGDVGFIVVNPEVGYLTRIQRTTVSSKRQILWNLIVLLL